MQNAAAIVFQGEAKWGWPPCSVMPLLDPFAASVDRLHGGEALAPPFFPSTVYIIRVECARLALFIRSLTVCAHPLFGLVSYHQVESHKAANRNTS